MEPKQEQRQIGTAVQTIKQAILQSQLRAVKAVNQEQLALYFGIGRYVSENTRKGFWGKGAIAAISEQLRKELPGLRGFSKSSIKNMRMFFEEWRALENGNSPVPTGEITNINNQSAIPTDEIVATYKTSADMDERMRKLLPSIEELEKLL